MNRRAAIKNLALASGTLITLPFWMGCGTNDKPAKHLSSFSAEEGKIIAAITDAIIPAGNAIGALSVGVDKFLQKLFDDCYEKNVQENIKTQVKKLDVLSNEELRKPFAEANQQERQKLLLRFSSSQDKNEKDFFILIKSDTIKGFNTSQQVMEKYLHYKVAPGHYLGCVNVSANA
jgi:hypothetical protein